MKTKAELLVEIFDDRDPGTYAGGNLRPAMKRELEACGRARAHSNSGVRDFLIAERKEAAIAELASMLDAQAELATTLATVPIPSAGQIRALAFESMFIVPDESFKAIAALQAAWELDMAGMMAHLPRAANDAHRAHQEKIVAGIVAGDGADIHEGWTAEDWAEDFRQKKAAYNLAIKRHSVAAFEVVKPLLENFEQHVSEFIHQRRANEQSVAEAFHIAWRPSDVLLLAMKAEQCIRQRIDGFTRTSGESPESIAGFLF